MSKKDKDPKVRIIDIFLRLIKIKKMTPSRSELMRAGVSRDNYRQYFGTIADLREAARLKDSKAFDNMIDETVFTPKILKNLRMKRRNLNDLL